MKWIFKQMDDNKSEDRNESSALIYVFQLLTILLFVISGIHTIEIKDIKRTNRDLTEIIKESTRLDSLQNSKIKTLEQRLKYTNIKVRIQNK